MIPTAPSKEPTRGARAIRAAPAKTPPRRTTRSLLFSDIDGATIWKLVPPSTFTTFRPASGKSNGLAWDPAGRLLACEHDNRRVSRSNADGSSIVTFVDNYGGKKFNSPNDVIARSDGNVYFTDPDYGLLGRPAELTFKGVFRVDGAGKLTLVDDTMNQPNGIAFSPDEKTLYVGDTGAPVVNKWTVAADGTVSGKTKFASVSSDGMSVDDAGNLYFSGGGQIQVFKPNGDKWGSIAFPETTTNSAFGGDDRKTLFVSAGKSIYTVVLKIPGKG